MRPLWPRFLVDPRTARLLCFWLVLIGTGVRVGSDAPSALAEPLTGSSASAPEPAHPALTRVAFAALLKRFQRQSFGDEQLSVTRAAIRGGGYFTCEQAGQLLRASAFGDDRGKIAATLYPRIVDPENFAQLVATLTSEVDRQTRRNRVGP